MKARMILLVICGFFLLGITDCDDGDDAEGAAESDESGDSQPADDEDIPDLTGDENEFQIGYRTFYHMGSDEFGVALQADRDLVESYVKEMVEADEEPEMLFEVNDSFALRDLLNADLLADSKADMNGTSGAYPRRGEIIFDGLSEMSEDELKELCEVFSEYLAGEPEHVELVGPVIFVGSHMVESEDEPGFYPVTPVFYNDRLAPGDTGSCTVL